MKQAKSNNSILLLTTLGVYLGLLVVGSAPGLIAQQAAATTRNFELSEEIEVKDDLDKNPDQDRVLKPKNDQDNKFSEFVLAYSKYIIADFKSLTELFREIDADCPGVCIVKKLTYFPTFEPDLQRTLGVSDYQVSITSEEDGSRGWKIRIPFNTSAQELNDFQNVFNFAPVQLRKNLSVSEIVVIQNTTLTFEQTHLVVVTRLPRAALDELLAANAK